MRSRAVLRPLACCFSTAFAEPAWTASSSRRSRSASLPAVVWMSMSGSVGRRCPRRAASARGSRCSAVCSADCRANLVPMPTVPHRRPPLDPDASAVAGPAGGRGASRRRRSTNAASRPRARAGERGGAGRGRRAPDRRPRPARTAPGRRRRGAALTFSVAAATPASTAERWPLAAAAGRVRRRTRRSADRLPEVALKWPNDVLRRGPQGRRHPGRAGRDARPGPVAVVGIGINVDQTLDELPVADGHLAARSSCGEPVDRTDAARRRCSARSAGLLGAARATPTRCARRTPTCCVDARPGRPRRTCPAGDVLDRGEALDIDAPRPARGGRHRHGTADRRRGRRRARRARARDVT